MLIIRMLLMSGVVAASVCISPACQAALVIGSAPTEGVVCSQGSCAPTAAEATLNVDDVRAFLQTGNLSVITSGSGSVEADDIIVKAPLGWRSGSTLALTAKHSILVKGLMNVEGIAGLTIATNGGHTDGRLAFGSKGRIRFAKSKSKLVINGSQYALVGNITELLAAIRMPHEYYVAWMDNHDASVDKRYRSSPIPDYFVGTLEGLGNGISNLRITADLDKQRNVGLFSEMNGTISNFRVFNVDIAIDERRVGFIGGLVGLTDNSALMIGDEVTGTITSKRSAVGGLVGLDTGSIVDSTAHVNVMGSTAGGLVAVQQNFQNQAPGIISRSSASGSVFAKYGIAGGLAGQTEAPIDQSFATGSVDGQRPGAKMGGLVGQVSGSATITNCYAFGDVGQNSSPREKSGRLGGLIGAESGGGTATSYSTGRPAHPHSSGGFVGANEGTTNTADYWNVSTSRFDLGVGSGAADGVTGLTTPQLKSGLPAGFDPAIWGQNRMVNNGLPYLINNPPR